MFFKSRTAPRLRRVSENSRENYASAPSALMPKIIFAAGTIAGVCLCFVIIGARGCLARYAAKHESESILHNMFSNSDTAAPDTMLAVRDKPATFPRNTWLPKTTEGEASGSNDPKLFSPGRDLVFFDDPRAWWKSDNRATGDTGEDCAHSMHKSMVEPLTRLLNLAAETQWTLKIQGCYEPGGPHASRSLHKQGRAIDLTFGDPANPTERLSPDQMRVAYEELAKLAYQAGFDWVFYEYGTGTGPHVHASVRVERDLPPAVVK